MQRKLISLLSIAVLAVCAWLAYRGHANRLTIRTYFHDVRGLQLGARVRANGVDVGKVKAISLDARSGDLPVEVVLALDGRYVASIPSDATASLATEGLLGPPMVEIDVSKCSGSPIGNNGVLKSVETSGDTNLVKSFVNVLKDTSKELEEATRKLQNAQEKHHGATARRNPSN
jgi:phospholipid/cholesterol/gamma-HCH transport system substrate-binding protein